MALDRMHKIIMSVVMSTMIVAVTHKADVITTEDVIMTASVTKDVVMIVTAKDYVTMIVTTTAIMTEALTDEALFLSVIRPVVAKTINVSHNFSKDLKFNISKSECHVIICMALFFAKFEIF